MVVATQPARTSPVEKGYWLDHNPEDEAKKKEQAQPVHGILKFNLGKFFQALTFWRRWPKKKIDLIEPSAKPLGGGPGEH